MSTETHLDRLWDGLRIDHFSTLAETYYAEFRALLAAELAKVPTSVFITIVLSICIPPLVALFFYEQHCSKTSAAKPQGCKKLGMRIESNLSNEFDANFSKGRPASTEETSAEWWRVKSMWIYPVKSCKGVELNHASIVSAGMEYDRQFTFAQLKKPVSPVLAPATGADGAKAKPKPKHKWEFITQRQFPKLANVKTQMWVPDFNSPSYRPHDDDVEAGGVIIISFPYQEAGLKGLIAALGAKLTGNVPEMEFRVPFNPTPAQVEKAGYSVEECTIWKDTVSALNMEIEIPDELRYYLGMNNKLGLFRIDNSDLREVHRCAPKAEDVGFQPVTGFQDAYPLHLINLASVRDVERQMPKSKDIPRLSAQRFRANIIITGPEPYTEESWKKIKIGFYEYAVSCRTVRCKMPNIDPNTGEKHPSQPDKTLRSFRNVDAGAPNLGCLGMQLVPLSQTCEMKCGEELTALEHGEHVYIPQ